MNRAVFLLIVALFFYFSPHCFLQIALAEEEEPKKELPKSGVLSSTYSGGATNVAADLPWGDEVGAKDPSPVTGSISRAGERTWKVRLFNNSKGSPYSISVEAVQYAKNGNPVKRDSYSYSLRPGETKEVEVGAAAGVERAELKLLRWRDLSSKPMAAETTAKKEGGEAKKEAKQGEVVAKK